MATFTVDLLTGNLYLFNGNFGGTSSGSTYPEVNTFANLPLPNLHAGEIYVVRSASGIYVINRKDAGMYYSNGSTWKRLGDTPSYFNSGNFQIYDSIDSTKGITFDVSNLSSGSFRTIKFKNSDGTVAYLTDLNTKVDLSVFTGYTASTTPILNSAITSATNLGTGTGIYTSVLNKNISFKSIKGIGGIVISGNTNEIVISGGSGSGGSQNLQQVTAMGASTNIESSFRSGIVTNKIRPSGDTTTAIQIRKADNLTPIISIDSISGLTGFGTLQPRGLVHAYGKNSVSDVNNTQTNAFVIDGDAGVDKDIQWADEGQVKWLAETYRGENGKFWYFYNVSDDNSPLTISETGRIGVNAPTNVPNYHASLINGGPNDISIGGAYTENYTSVFEIIIDSVSGITDTFKWRRSINEGQNYSDWSIPINCSSGDTLIGYGVTVKFESITGHVLGTTYIFGAFSQLPIGTFVVSTVGFVEVVLTRDYTANPIIYNNVTADANSGLIGNDILVFNTGTTVNSIYFGTRVKIDNIYVNMTTPGSNMVVVAEYWNGINWTVISNQNYSYVDKTENLIRSGAMNWDSTLMGGWIPAYLPDLSTDGFELYWIRLRTTTNPIIAPLVNSFVRGGNYRLGVLSSPTDYRPSFYVDSLGRVNVGGGNITGKNKLQINSGNNVQVTSTGTDSLVEFDSEDSTAVDLKIKLSSDDNIGPALTFVKTRGKLDTSSCTQTGDILGAVKFRGRAGTSGRLLAEVGSQFVGSPTTRCGDIYFNTANGSDPVEAVRINYMGNTGFGVSPTAVIHLKSGTTTNAALKFTTGALLNTPAIGVIEFNGNSFYGTTTGNIRKTFAFLESPIFSGTPNFPSGTTFAQGLATCSIRPLVDGIQALHIHQADNITPIVTFDTISGFTGFGKSPDSIINTYGSDNTAADGWNYQKNGIRIDGGFDADKDIQWYSEGQPAFAAQVYRCENGKFWYLSSPLGHINQLTVSSTGRIGVNNQTNIMDYHATLLTGGPNDIKISGYYTQNYTIVYEIEIDAISGTTDTFRWRKSLNEGNSFNGWSVPSGCTTGATHIDFGVKIEFGSVKGHTLGTRFIFGAFAQLPVGTFMVTPSKFQEVLQTNDYTAGTIVYDDITGEANSSSFGSNINIFNTGSTKNAVYFGTLDKLNSIYVNLNSAGQGVTLITEYWNGLTWTNLVPTNNSYHDGTLNLIESGVITWETNSMVDWVKSYMPDMVEDGYELYWVRIRTSTNPTISPNAKSFARNGNYRIGVLSSPNDFKPSFYVDSLGRTNIGGGNISGCNLFQINNSEYIDTTCGTSNSLFEIDSNCSNATDMRIRLSSDDSCSAGVTIAKTRGSLNSATSIQHNDIISHICSRGRVANTGFTLTTIESQYVGDGISRFADIIFSTANNSTPIERMRITGSGATGFGIANPNAVVHLKAGTCSVSPLKFTSGTLLNVPQSGAIEFRGDKYYGTTTGNTRNTFAFLENPIFIGNVSLPSTTCLNNVNLCNFILNSGGTNNSCLVRTSAYCTYTGTTAPNTYLKLNQSSPQSVTGGAPKFDQINHYTGYTTNGNELTGTRFWDCNNHTSTLVLENGVRLQEGQELHMYGKNLSGSIIRNGQPVSIVSNPGQFTAFGKVDITTQAAYAYAGLATQEIGVNNFGYVTIKGVVNDINTNHLDEGKSVYVDITGGTTKTYPSVPNYVVVIGIVERKSATNGRINVVSQIVPKLYDLSDVNGTPLNTSGQFPVWNNTNKYFDFTGNINNFLLQSTFNVYSGTTVPNTYYNKTQINNYTGKTSQVLSKVITGATNGLRCAGCNVSLGGNLIQNTVITGNTHNLTLSSCELNLCAINGVNLINCGSNGICISSIGNHIDLIGNNSSCAEKTKLVISDTQTTFTDSRAVPVGIQYNADYSGHYTDRSLVDKAWVMSVVSGLSPKASVIVATTGNTTLSGLYTIDGVALTNGMRVLVKNQNSAQDNGIYVASASTWTRASDFDGTPAGEVVQNAFTAVISGNTNRNITWILSTPNPITVGVTPLTFVIYSQALGVIGGNGICVTQSSGNYNIATKLATNSSLCSDASGLYVNSNIAGTGLQYSTGVINLNGSGLAGNSICWSGNSFNVDINTGTLSTALFNKLNKTCFNLYTGTTAPSAFASKSFLSTYTGTTVPNTYLSKTSFNTYSGTTVPNTYYSKTQINAYTGTTAPSTFASKSFVSTYTGTTAPNTYLSKTSFNTYSGTTVPNTYYSKTQINNYTGNTVPSTYLSKTSFNTYSGTTVPNAYLSKTSFNSYSGTTVPNTYYSKTQINNYSGATNNAISLKAPIANPTFTTSACAPNPACNDKSTCIATTCWYICQCATALPLMDGIANAGTSTLWTKQDHVHPSDTSRATVAFVNLYTGTTAPSTFASKSFLSTYTGTTVPNTYLSKTSFNTYSGTTVPNTYYSKTQIDNYSGATNTLIGRKAYLSGATFTGVVNVCKPAQNDNSNCVATTSWYISQGSTTNPLMDGTAGCGTSNLFARQDHVHPTDTSRASASFLSTYTGTTVPNTYLSKTSFSTYSGTTVPNTYYSKTQINAYTGTTAPNAFASKSFLSTYTGTTVPNTYLSKASFGTYSGTTVPNTYLSKTSFGTYSGTTVPNTYYSKTLINNYTGATNTRIGNVETKYISGGTNLGTANGVFVSVSTHNLQFKTLRQGPNIRISGGTNEILISGASTAGGTPQVMSATFILGNGTPITTGVNKTNILYVPRAGNITKVLAYAKTGPVGADIIFDINKNSTSIWNSTQANRLKIVAGGTTGSQTSFDTTVLAAEDILSIDIDQIGSSTAGQDITVQVFITAT